MTVWIRLAPRALFTILLCHALSAQAADVVVLTAGALKPTLLDLAPDYEATSRDILVISNDTAGGVSARIARGEEADLVILPLAALERLAEQGRVAADSVAPLAKTGIGVAVKAGAPPPDIASAEAFKRALLAAPSIAYIDPAASGSSGIYLAKLFERLGIADPLHRKSVLVPGGLVGSRVANGEAAIGLQQMSELRAVSGITVVGPLPPELQNYTVYAAGVPTAARRPAAGRALLARLRSEAVQRVLTVRGLEPP